MDPFILVLSFILYLITLTKSKLVMFQDEWNSKKKKIVLIITPRLQFHTHRISHKLFYAR